MTLAQIRQKLATDPRWAERAIVVLYDRQIEDEKDCSATIEANGIGFNSFDAGKLSAFAMHIQKGNHLSGRELYDAQQMVPKYANQILSIIKSKTT